ncbi:MAG: ABC transporter ATP-binding protein [Burkholderiales bacterium]|nr:ABC transporter ATP-binding protein [Burkholderiales bacterium]
MISLLGIERVFLVGDQPVRALRGIDLEIGAGEYVSLMGPSGSGKSTLLNIVGLLDRASAGSYRLDGLDVTALSDEQQARVRREKIGFVFQFFHLIARLSAQHNVELPMLLAGIPAAERTRRSDDLLRRYGLAERAHHKPEQLSGGQRQRVAIARATVMRPPVLLADEPTGNLDRASGQEVVRILEDLHGAGTTLIVVTHDPDLGARAPRRLRMVDGRIEQDLRG